MVTVMGATGNTGRKITEIMLEGGEEVRALGRSPEKLAELDGSEPSLCRRCARRRLPARHLRRPTRSTRSPRWTRLCPTTTPTRTRGEAIASAIRESGVRDVVALSAIGGELASANGFIASLHRQERRLRRSTEST